jgi:hypothetical protein
MQIVKIYGVPDTTCHDAIVAMLEPLRFAIANSKKGVSTSSVAVFFVHDMVQDGLGEELYVELAGLDDLRWTKTERMNAAENVAQALEVFVRVNIPQCRIVCVRPIPISGSLVGCVNKYIATL